MARPALRLILHTEPLPPPPDRASTLDLERRPLAGPDLPSLGVAVVDVLRATSTLAHAFAAGAREALFFADPAGALAARDDPALRTARVCGERDGRRLPGFDLGNSPAEYTGERVEGSTLLFASTNGSFAFLATATAPVQWAAAFVNREAALAAMTERAVGAVTGEPAPAAPLRIVCAGKLGRAAPEDGACARSLAEGLAARLAVRGIDLELRVEGPEPPPAPADAARTRALLEAAPHGRYLASLGREFERDLERCAAWDAVSALPTGSGARLRRSAPRAPESGAPGDRSRPA